MFACVVGISLPENLPVVNLYVAEEPKQQQQQQLPQQQLLLVNRELVERGVVAWYEHSVVDNAGIVAQSP